MARTSRPRRFHRLAAVIAVMTLSACGSQVSPDTVAVLNGQTGVVGADGGSGALVDPGSPVGQDGTSTDSGTATDTGAGGDSGSSGADSGAGGADSGSTGGDQPAGEGQTSADGGVKAGSCDGFKNSTGITDSEITVANIADISGPVPGLFQASQDAAKAFITYYNSTNPDGICGRSLKLLALDSRSDAGGDQQASVRACDEAFAGVGSISATDQGGAAAAENCGFPDIRSVITHPDRKGCSTCYSSYANSTNLAPSAIPEYWLKNEPEASQAVGMYYVNVPAASVTARSYVAAYEKAGMKVVVSQAIDVSEFNYSVYAQQMKDEGVRFVQYFGPYQYSLRLQRAMEQQGVEVDVYFEDATIYDKGYTDEAGDTAIGNYVFLFNGLFDDTSIPEMVLYRQWLERVAPGSVPNYYGLFAWSATRLFVQEATKLGGDLTRASLAQAYSRVNNWTANGMHAPMTVGSKQTGRCLQIAQYAGDGVWKRVSPGKFMCGSLIDSGIG